MFPQRLVSLALLLSGMIGVLAGCSTTKPPVAVSSPDKFDPAAVPLPRRFTGYHDLFSFIASQIPDGMPTDEKDEKTLFKLAADSTIKIIGLQTGGYTNLPTYVYLVTPHYYNGGIYDHIRGAQGNGSYFVLRPLGAEVAGLDTDRGFELIGIADGNTYRFRQDGPHMVFETHWHGGAGSEDDDWMKYTWNGRFFEGTK